MGDRTLNILAIEALVKIHRCGKARDKFIDWLVKSASPSLIGFWGRWLVYIVFLGITHSTYLLGCYFATRIIANHRDEQKLE